MNLSDIFHHHSFFALWRPDFFLIVVVLGTIYALVTGPYRTKLKVETEPVSKWKRISFYTGLFIFYLTHGTPLHVIGFYYLFSAHMLQMATTYMVVVPLLILGIPEWGFEALLGQGRRRRIFAILTHPLVAVLSFNLMLGLYHVPAIFDFVMSIHALHLTYHYFLTFASILLWWPIISPLKGEHQMVFLKKFAYILAGSVLITPVCALVIFAQDVIYTTYVDAPRLFETLTVHYDQQLGGIIMKLLQELAFATALMILIYLWFQKDNPGKKIDPIDERYLSSISGEEKVSLNTGKPSTEQGGT